jgi:hypothetical protein
LYGANGSLIDLTGQTTTTYGITVGSTTAGSDTYTGNMYIDKSVTANISTSSNNDSSGVRISSTVTGSTTIDGNFSISSTSYETSYGVLFNSTAAGSILNIGGNFSFSCP